MIGVFSSVAGFLKRKEITITNNVFALHYKVTVVLLLAFSLLGTQKQYFGDPIDCLTVQSHLSGIMDIYCWVHSTYIFPEITVDKGISHGVGSGKHDMEKKYYSYYQWVPLFLFFQALLFYIPYNLWTTWEGKRMEKVLLDLQDPLLEEETQRKKSNLLVDFFVNHRSNHKNYAFKFYLCELINFVHVIGQIYFVDMFLGYEFSTYGYQVASFTGDDLGSRVDPMEHVFPKLTKCKIDTYGFSGTNVPGDILCVLPINVINEKIFVFLWFWFVILAAVTGVFLVYRLIVIFVPMVRSQLLINTMSPPMKYIALDVAQESNSSDWFFINQLQKNMDAIAFEHFLSQLHGSLKKKS